jgi:hypothetical protein
VALPPAANGREVSIGKTVAGGLDPPRVYKIVSASNVPLLVWLSGWARVLAELTPRFAQCSWWETAVIAGEQMAAVGDYSDSGEWGFRKCSVCYHDVEHDIHDGQAVSAVADSPRSAHPSSPPTESQQLWRYEAGRPLPGRRGLGAQSTGPGI